MSVEKKASSPTAVSSLTNGSGAAALLAAGIGSFLLAVLAIAADRIASLAKMMIFHKPTGPLSGVTTSAIIVWLIIWAVLDVRWKNKTVASGRIAAWALALLGVSLLLMFPPIADLF